MTLGRIILLVAALAYGAIGMFAILLPQETAAVVYIAPDVAVDPTGLPPTGATEIRAGYGGLGLSIGLFFLYCAWVTRLVRPGLILAFLALFAAVVGRVLGIVSDGAQEAYTWIMLFIEAGGAIVVAYALLSKRDSFVDAEREYAAPSAPATPKPVPAAPVPTSAPAASTASSAPPASSPAPPPPGTSDEPTPPSRS